MLFLEFVLHCKQKYSVTIVLSSFLWSTYGD